MKREEAIKTLKENCCAMCAYCSKDMDSCDICSCDNKDAIEVLEQEPCTDAIKYFTTIYELSQTLGVPYDFVDEQIKKAITALKVLPPVTPTDNKCQECKKDWTKCSKCLVTMKWIKEQKARWKNEN